MTPPTLSQKKKDRKIRCTIAFDCFARGEEWIHRLGRPKRMGIHYAVIWLSQSIHHRWKSGGAHGVFVVLLNWASTLSFFPSCHCPDLMIQAARLSFEADVLRMRLRMKYRVACNMGTSDHIGIHWDQDLGRTYAYERDGDNKCNGYGYYDASVQCRVRRRASTDG